MAKNKLIKREGEKLISYIKRLDLDQLLKTKKIIESKIDLIKIEEEMEKQGY